MSKKVQNNVLASAWFIDVAAEGNIHIRSMAPDFGPWGNWQNNRVLYHLSLTIGPKGASGPFRVSILPPH